MRERTALDDAGERDPQLEQELEDGVDLIELGEAEGDEAIDRGGRGRHPRGQEARPRAARSRRCSRARPTATTPISRSMPAPAAPRARTGRRCCCACTRAGPSARGFKVELLEQQDGEEAGIKARDPPDQGPQRLWLAEDRIRRAPAGAHLAVRFERPPAHQLRLGLGLSGDRRPHRHRDQRERRAASTPTARRRRRRPARQHDRFGGAHHPHPDRHRGRLPAASARSTRTARPRGTCCAPSSTSAS